MKDVTLYEQNRNDSISDLPLVHWNRLVDALADTLKENTSGEYNLPSDTKVADLDGILNIHFVDKNRDLSSVAPIAPADYFSSYRREDLKPLLDALSKGDFELAEALTPEKYRLCGYTELKETTRMEEYGHGWAGQFAITEVPPGIYPIFADKFAYHERNRHYTNEVHYCGILEWYEGQCTQSDNIYEKHPYAHTVLNTPYAYNLANNITKGTGKAHLIHPFKAASASQVGVEGKPFVYYRIIDSSLPYKVDFNPLELRGKALPVSQKESLSEKIHAAENKKTVLPKSSLGSIWRSNNEMVK